MTDTDKDELSTHLRNAIACMNKEKFKCIELTTSPTSGEKKRVFIICEKIEPESTNKISGCVKPDDTTPPKK